MISLRLPPDLLERIDAQAENKQRSRAFIVREALEKRFPKPQRPATNDKGDVISLAASKKPVKKAGAR